MTMISKRPMRCVQALVFLGILLCMFHTGVQLARLEFGRLTEEPSSYHFGVDLFLSFNKKEPPLQHTSSSSSSSLKNNQRQVPGNNNNDRTATTAKKLHDAAASSFQQPTKYSPAASEEEEEVSEQAAVAAKNVHLGDVDDDEQRGAAAAAAAAIPQRKQRKQRKQQRLTAAVQHRKNQQPPQSYQRITPDELAQMAAHAKAFAARQKAMREERNNNNDNNKGPAKSSSTDEEGNNEQSPRPPTGPTTVQDALQTTTSLSPRMTRLNKLLLNTPFYVYEELYWLNDATVGNMSAAAWIQTEMEIKHTDDWWFAKAAMRHPMRTMDPTQAKLFIVPALLNMAVDQVINFSSEWDNYTPEWRFHAYNTSLCYNGLCNLQLIEYVNQFLSESAWFQRHQGQDHIVVASHWASEWVIPRYNHLASCNVIGWEQGKWNRLDREMMPSLYVGNGCRPVQQLGDKTDDFAMIGSLRNRPAFKDRRQICKWMKTTGSTINMTICGPGRQCPALAKARFGFHARGDTWGSNRLMDTLLSGTVPVITSMEQYDMLPDWIDWNLISNFAHAAQRKQFLKDVKKMAKDTEDWEEKMRHVLLNRELFDWKTLVPFDVYLYQLSVQLWPQDEWERREKHPISTPFTALKLPQISASSTSSSTSNKPNNNNNAAVDVTLESFQAFTQNKHNGNTNCGGINEYVNSCDECVAAEDGKQKESACFGGCMWCEHGSVKVGDSDYLWSLDNQQQQPEGGKQDASTSHTHIEQCVHRSQRCRLESSKTTTSATTRAK